MFWKESKLTYKICIPPLNKHFYEFSSEETEAFFAWHTQILPERLDYLVNTCSRMLEIDKSSLNLSPESLTIIWKWFLKIADIERTPSEQLDYLKEVFKKHPIGLQDYILEHSKQQFSLQTEYILRDIGMYLGEVFIKNNKTIHWGYYEKPKSDFFVNMPVLLGFEDKRFEPPFKAVFEPIHMAGVQACKIWRNEQNEQDLLILYHKWLTMVPNI